MGHFFSNRIQNWIDALTNILFECLVSYNERFWNLPTKVLDFKSSPLYIYNFQETKSYNQVFSNRWEKTFGKLGRNRSLHGYRMIEFEWHARRHILYKVSELFPNHFFLLRSYQRNARKNLWQWHYQRLSNMTMNGKWQFGKKENTKV